MCKGQEGGGQGCHHEYVYVKPEHAKIGDDDWNMVARKSLCSTAVAWADPEYAMRRLLCCFQCFFTSTGSEAAWAHAERVPSAASPMLPQRLWCCMGQILPLPRVQADDQQDVRERPSQQRREDRVPAQKPKITVRSHSCAVYADSYTRAGCESCWV